MAFDMAKDDRVGCAYYVAMDEILYLEEDVVMGGLDAVETTIFRVQPTTVIIPTRAPGPLLELLERNTQRFEDDTSDSYKGYYILRHLVSAEFDYEVGKEMPIDLDPEPSESEPLQMSRAEDDDSAHCISSSRHGRLMRLTESINLDSHLSIGRASAVLGDINRRRTTEDVPSVAGTPPLFRARYVIMNRPMETMLVSADAFISPQIVRAKLHPNPQVSYSNGSESKTRKSSSVYGLLQAFASTTHGKARLRQMLFCPSTNIEMIRQRQKTVAVFLRLDNKNSVTSLQKLLRKTKNAKTLLCHIKRELTEFEDSYQLESEIGKHCCGSRWQPRRSRKQ